MADQNKDTLSNEAREAQRAYKREWRKKNRDKVKNANKRYWEKKAMIRRESKEAANHE